MSVETRSITLKGNDYLLIKSTGQKRVTKNNLASGEKIVVEDVRTPSWLMNDLKNVSVEVPDKVIMSYSGETSLTKGFKLENVKEMFLNLADNDTISSVAKRLLKRGLR